MDQLVIGVFGHFATEPVGVLSPVSCLYVSSDDTISITSSIVIENPRPFSDIVQPFNTHLIVKLG